MCRLPFVIRLGLLLSAALFPFRVFSQDSADPWIDPSYVCRMAITNMSPAEPSQSLTDFPVLVSLTNATWLDNILPDGGDITFAGVDGRQLFHEIEQFDDSTKTLTAWVCLPTFSNQTRFYMYWKNLGPLSFHGSNSTTSLSLTLPSLATPKIGSNVWDSNFIMVWHLANTNGAPTDSTRYGLHCTTNSTNFSSNRAGIGLSRGYYSTPAHADPNFAVGLRTTNHRMSAALQSRMTNGVSMTFSFWFKHETFPSNASSMGTNIAFSNAVGGGATTNTNKQMVMFAAAQNNSTGIGDGVGFLVYDPTGRPTVGLNTKGGTSSGPGVLTDPGNRFSPLTGVLDNWNYTAVTGGASTGKLALMNDGASFAAYSGAFPMTNNLSDIYVFGGSGGGSGVNFSRRYSPWGWGDELRYSMVARSSNWSLTEYSNTVLSTNLALTSGVQPVAISSMGWVTVTNVGGRMTAGTPFRGMVLAGAGVLSNTLIVSNLTGGEVYRTEVTRDSATSWSATPLLPQGSYSVTARLTTRNGFTTQTSPVTFQWVIPYTVSIRTLTTSSVPWVEGRVQGPRGNGAAGFEIRTNSSTGEAAFSNLFSGDVLTFVNYTPVTWGSVAVQTNFIMPESNVSLAWVLDAPWTAVDPDLNPSGRLDTAYFIGSQSPTLKLRVAQATNGALRVTIDAIPLARGHRVTLFDNTVASSDPVARIDGADLKKYIKPGIWILEIRATSGILDVSRIPVTRRLLFYAQ